MRSVIQPPVSEGTSSGDTSGAQIAIGAACDEEKANVDEHAQASIERIMVTFREPDGMCAEMRMAYSLRIDWPTSPAGGGFREAAVGPGNP